MTLIIRTSKAALPKLATICYTFMHSRRLPRFELPLFPSKWRTTLELGNNFSDLFECLSFFLHDSRFFLVPSNICITPCSHRIWSVSVSDNIWFRFRFRGICIRFCFRKKCENKCGTTQLRPYLLCFHP
jgi:hypothetical protein